MTHVLSMFDSEYLHHYDLSKPEVTVKIARVIAGELTGQGGRKSKKPIVYFEGAAKGLALNKTNARAIMSMYGADVEAWVGQPVTLYTTTTEMAGEVVGCIRVKAGRPNLRAVEA